MTTDKRMCDVIIKFIREQRKLFGGFDIMFLFVYGNHTTTGCEQQNSRPHISMHYANLRTIRTTLRALSALHTLNTPRDTSQDHTRACSSICSNIYARTACAHFRCAVQARKETPKTVCVCVLLVRVCFVYRSKHQNLAQP